MTTITSEFKRGIAQMFFCNLPFTFALTLALTANSGPVLFGQSFETGSSGDWLEFGSSRQWSSPMQLRPDMPLFLIWEAEIGEGRSQSVGQSGVVYVTSGTSKESSDGSVETTTRVLALDANNGKVIWTYVHSGAFRGKQQTFSGAAATPQSTPAIVGDRLLVVTFTGQLLCLDNADGQLQWERDLVDEFGAKPVQYGFSSSPVIDTSRPDRAVVQALGENGGLYCLDTDDGSVVWKSDCSTPSYSTPVSASFGGEEQWVIVSELEVAGIEKRNGKRLWQYELPDGGLTMVPTPMVVDDTHLIVSGQGCRGTRCISVTFEDEWQVAETWYARRLEYFYTNWIKLNERVAIGSNDQFLAAFDMSGGSVLAKWRGFEDGNMIRMGDDILLVDKQGKGTLLSVNATDNNIDGLTAIAEFPIFDSRVWTAPSTMDNKLLVRSGNRLVCLSSSNPGDVTEIELNRDNPQILEFDEFPERPVTPNSRRQAK